MRLGQSLTTVLSPQYDFLMLVRRHVYNESGSKTISSVLAVHIDAIHSWYTYQPTNGTQCLSCWQNFQEPNMAINAQIYLTALRDPTLYHGPLRFEGRARDTKMSKVAAWAHLHILFIHCGYYFLTLVFVRKDSYRKAWGLREQSKYFGLQSGAGLDKNIMWSHVLIPLVVYSNSQFIRIFYRWRGSLHY